MPPTTGTKLSTAYFAARMATPSMEALHTPCMDIAPRNTVKLTPSSQHTALRSRWAMRVRCARSERWLTVVTAHVHITSRRMTSRAR